MDNNLPPNNDNQPKDDLNINPPTLPINPPTETEIPPVPKMPEIPATPPPPPPKPLKPEGNINIPEPEQKPEEQKPEEKPIEIGSLGNPSSFTSYTQATVNDDNNTGNRKDKKFKTIASVLGLILIIAALPLTVILVKQRQEIRKEAKIGGVVTIANIKNVPISEILPTAANGGTYSTTFRITNNASGTRTVVLGKMICVCSEREGNPPGLCHNCSTSNETVTLSAGQSIERTLSARQPNQQPSEPVCGSFQLDLVVVSVK